MVIYCYFLLFNNIINIVIITIIIMFFSVYSYTKRIDMELSHSEKVDS